MAAYIIRRSVIKRNRKIERQLEEIMFLSDALKRSEKLSKSDETSSAGRVIKAYNQTIDTLCDRFYDGLDSKTNVSLLKIQIDSVISSFREGESMNAIRELVNDNCNSILDKIATALPEIKETDLNFIALMLAGFSPRAISFIMGIKRQSFYSKRLRLIEKLEKKGITI